MSYGEKFYTTWKDDNNNSWRASIMERSYAGSATEFTAGATPCVIRRGSSTENKFEPIIGSECTLSVMVTGSETFRGLIDADEEKYLIYITFNSSAYWVGHLTQDTWTEVYTGKPYEIKLRAIDGLERLKNVNANGTNNWTLQLISAFITGAVQELEYYTYFSGILECVNVYENSHSTATSDSPFKQTQLDRSAFYKNDRGFTEYKSYYEALESIMTAFGCRMFIEYEPTLDGIYVIIQRVAEGTTSPVVRRYNTSYTYVDTPSIDWDLAFSDSATALNPYNAIIPINQDQTLEIIRGVPYAELSFDPLHPRGDQLGNALKGGKFEERLIDSDWASSTSLNDWTTGASATIQRFDLPYHPSTQDRNGVRFTATNSTHYIECDNPVVYFEGPNADNKIEVTIRASYRVPTFTATAGTIFSIQDYPTFQVEFRITNGVNTYYLEQSATTGVLNWIPAVATRPRFKFFDMPAILESEDWTGRPTATFEWDRYTDFQILVPTPPIEGDVYIRLYNFLTSGSSPALNQRQIEYGGSTAYEDCQIIYRQVLVKIVSATGLSSDKPVIYRVNNSNNVTGQPYTSSCFHGDARDGAGLNVGLLYDDSDNLTSTWARRGVTETRALLEITVNDHLANYKTPTFKLNGTYRYGNAENICFAASYSISDDGTRYMLPYYWEQNLQKTTISAEFLQNGGTFSTFVTPTIGTLNPIIGIEP